MEEKKANKAIKEDIIESFNIFLNIVTSGIPSSFAGIFKATLKTLNNSLNKVFCLYLS